MNHEITKLEQRELVGLAHSINDREELIESLKSKTYNCASQTVTEAIMQGRDLYSAKLRVGHGNWLDWLKSHCPTVSVSTAERRIKLAQNSSHVKNLDSLRQAYLLCYSRGEQDSEPKKEWPAYMRGYQLFFRAAKYLGTHPLAEYPENTKTQLKKELEPVVKELWPERFAA